ncbi:uncharacterized protein LOC130014835 [Mercurialis annua]|uniref:uncharacterized protein LOC130014835 n=1 Tax=Mercurialis annua TaxID=3986 RepID=UPI0024AE7983|nr:uncharacterized protein LOC130014835 [Mercurialis annua]
MGDNSGILEGVNRLTILEEEEDVLDYSAEANVREAETSGWLVGRFLTDKIVNLIAMRQMMAFVWKPVRGVKVSEIKPNLFLFQFFHELDLARVVNEGPWTFEHHLFLCQEVKRGAIVEDMELWHADLWVHVVDIPLGYASEKLAQDAGKVLGGFITQDFNPGKTVGANTLRVRVRVDIRKPLKRRMKFKRGPNEWSWLNFQYERIPMFCFYCGVLGHSEKYCEKYFDNPIPREQLPYGVEMRFNPKKVDSKLGDRWLRDDSPVRVSKVQDDDDVEALNGKITGNLSIQNSNLNFGKGGEYRSDLCGGYGKDNGNWKVTSSNKQQIPYSKGFDDTQILNVEDVVVADAKRKRSNKGDGLLALDIGPSFHNSDMMIDSTSDRPVGPGFQARPAQ